MPNDGMKLLDMPLPQYNNYIIFNSGFEYDFKVVRAIPEMIV